MSHVESARSLLIRHPLTSVLPVAVGVGTALVAVKLSELGTNWLVYVLIALAGGLALPYAAYLAGGLQRLSPILFFFSLQLAAGFNLVYKDEPNPSGYNGIRLTLPFLIAVMAATWRLFQPGEPWVFHRPLLGGMLLMAVAGVLSIVNTTDLTLVMYGITNLLMLMFIGLVVCDMCAHRTGLELAERVLIVSLVTQCAVLLLQQATGQVIDLSGHPLEAFNSEGAQRYPGTLGRAPSIVAQFLAIMLVFAQGQWYAARGRAGAAMMAKVASGLGVLCLALSLTRSSWIAFVLSSTVIAVYWARRGALRLRTVVSVVAVIALAVLIAWPAVSMRLQADHQAATSEREFLAYIALEMVKAHPVLGVGLNCIRDHLYAYIPEWATGDEWIYVVHNQYLVVAAETGLVGLSAFLYTLFRGVRAAGRATRSRDPFISRLGITLVATFCVMLWGMNIDFYSGTQMYILLWTFLGFACGLEEFRKRQEQSALVHP